MVINVIPLLIFYRQNTGYPNKKVPDGIFICFSTLIFAPLALLGLQGEGTLTLLSEWYWRRYSSATANENCTRNFLTTPCTSVIFISWALAFAKSTALWKQCAQADWALSLLTPTTELWLPKLGIRRYHQSKPEFWTPPELSDTRMVISVNLSFGNTASLWIQGGLGHPSLSPVKKRISRSS